MGQITYANKVALNENPQVAAINKVTDDDMNEIKQVVNDNYNNTIQITDTEPTDSDNKIWIDTGEIGSAVSEITNSYSESTGLGYSANYINNLHTYSTTEHRVRTWIDGKPLYRKVVNGPIPTTSSNGVDVTSGIFVNDNIDTMIIEFAYIEMGSPDQRSRQLPFITTSGYRVAITTKCDENGGQSSALAPYNYLGVSNNYATYNGKNLVASILYTKTTD